jgi:ribonuclease T1
MPQPPVPSRRGQPAQWLRVAAFVVVLAIAAYSAWQREQVDGNGETEREATPAATTPAITENHDRATAEPAKEQPETSTTIANQNIRDQNGRVVFRGQIDVGPTLERIHRAERLEFSHDDTTFQNRERRLPQRPAGYYREYVHPTPGVSGPGPQRIVVGREGEIYYTPDHYRTFQRLDKNE